MDNVILSEKHFRDVVHNSNQTINFCSIVPHHPNFIDKHKIQTMMLGSKALIIYAKQYYPEANTIILCPYALKALDQQMKNIKVGDDGAPHTHGRFCCYYHIY